MHERVANWTITVESCKEDESILEAFSVWMVSAYELLVSGLLLARLYFGYGNSMKLDCVNSGRQDRPLAPTLCYFL